MDNNSFLYNIVPIKEDVLFVTQMKLQETKHFLISEGETFLKFPYLHTLSNIVDNCSQLILNREIKTKMKISEVKCNYIIIMIKRKKKKRF